jgi:phage major head subunit gpT-like protein
MIINSETIKALNKGFQARFLGAVGQVNRDAEKLAMKTTSSQAAEVYGDIAFFPAMRKLVGEAVVKNLKEVAHTVKNEEFEATVRVKQADVERDALGIYTPKIQQLGNTGAKLPSQLISDLLMNGFEDPDYTGTAFFAANKKHFPGGKKTFTNLGAKKLSAANFQTARAAIRNVLDESGNPLELGDRLALVVSPTYEATARSIVLADTISGGGTNVNKGTAELIVLPRLAAAEHNWFLVDIGQPMGALILQEERALELLTSATGMTTEALIMTHAYLWQAYWRGNAAYGLPQLAYGSTGADAA